MRAIFLVILSILTLSTAHAQSCSATNSNGSRTCSISCSVGQRAYCENATGDIAPTCECQADEKNGLMEFEIIPSAKTSTPTKSLDGTDVLVSVNAKLATLRDYNLRRHCEQQRTGRSCGREPCKIVGASEVSTKIEEIIDSKCLIGHKSRLGDCIDTFREVCSDVFGKLNATAPISVVSGPIVETKNPNWNDIPREIMGYRETYKNCSSVPQSVTFKHSESTLVGSRVSKSQVVKTGYGISAKVSFKYSEVLGGEVGATFNREVSVTDMNEENYTETKTFEITLPVAIPPRTKVRVEHYFMRRDVPVQFTGQVTLDAVVGGNQEGVRYVSAVLPSETDRTFKFSGTVNSALLINGETDLLASPVNAAQCKDITKMGLESEYYSRIK